MGLADHPFDLHCDVTPAGKPKIKKTLQTNTKKINFQVDRNEDDPRPKRPVFLRTLKNFPNGQFPAHNLPGGQARHRSLSHSTHSGRQTNAHRTVFFFSSSSSFF